MERTFRMGITMLALVGIIAGAPSCKANLAASIGHPQTGRGRTPAQDVTNSGCLGGQSKGSDPNTCSESLDLSWDGQSLLVQHWCYAFNCAMDFKATYEVASGALLLTERDAVKDLVSCDCVYDFSYRVSPDPGDYAFRLTFEHWDSGAWRGDDRFEGDISLPDGEAQSYHF